MNLADLDNLFARVARLTGVLKDKSGPGTSWDATAADGSMVKVVLTNVKSPDDLQDQFANLAVWTWSIKDHFKGVAQTLGTSPRAIEDYVNADAHLPLCADLANMLKHGELRESRSDRWPASVKVGYSITHVPAAPRTPLRSITFWAGGIAFEIGDPALVDVTFTVRDRSGAALPDGLECLANGIGSWEALLDRLVPAAKLAP